MIPVAAAVLQSSVDDLGIGSIVDEIGPRVSDLAGSLPEPFSPVGLVFYAAWGVFGLAAAKTIRGRVGGSERTDASAASTVAGDSGTATKGTTSVGTQISTGTDLGKDHAAFVLPSVIPLSKGIREVTHNEIHAFELGLVVGFVATWLLTSGRREGAILLALAFVAGTLGYKRYRTKAFQTVRLEPWYALVSFAVGGVAAWLFYRVGLPSGLL